MIRNSNLILAVALALALPAWANAFVLGGEQGNAHVRSFNSRLMGVELKYPDNWRYLDLSSMATFSENTELKTEASELILHAEEFSTIQTPGELRELLTGMDSQKDWKEIQVDGKAAYQNESENRGLIYVFLSPGQVLSIRFRVGQNELAQRQLVRVMKSIHFNGYRQP